MTALRTADMLRPMAGREKKSGKAKGSGSPMGKWRKTPPELIALFEQTITAVPEAETRKMFGYPPSFLKKEDAGIFEPMPGRPMKEYVTVPDQILAKPAELKKWLRQSFDYVSTLPPMEKKPRKNKPTGGNS